MRLPRTHKFPKGAQLQEFLGLAQSPQLDDLFSRSLFDPLQHLLSRPGKNLRSQLVRMGFQIGRRFAEASCTLKAGTMVNACAVLELIHAGSLIVDDIEDGSSMRRGAPSMHKLYGVPIALNAGNWLYFLTFKKIEDLDVTEAIRSKLLKECHQMLLRAHYGQALDVGVPHNSIPQHRVSEVTLAAIELKSGALAGFGLKVGSIVSGCPPNIADRLENFGRSLGVALQMYDDIGNVTSSNNTDKAAEDIKLRRLSFVVAVAARILSPTDFARLAQLDLESPGGLDQARRILTQHKILIAARAEADRFLQKASDRLQSELNLQPAEQAQLSRFRHSLRSSYE